MAVNSVVLVGRLTRDPELRTTNTGKSVCSFSLAVTKRIKPQDGSPDADFFNIVAWNKDADYVVNSREELEAKILAGLDSGPPIPVTPAFWEDVRKRVAERLAARARRQA